MLTAAHSCAPLLSIARRCLAVLTVAVSCSPLLSKARGSLVELSVASIGSCSSFVGLNLHYPLVSMGIAMLITHAHRGSGHVLAHAHQQRSTLLSRAHRCLAMFTVA